MKCWRKCGLVLLVALASVSCQSRSGTSDRATMNIDEDFVRETLRLSPTSATAQGLHESHGTLLDEFLDDLSPSGLKHSRDVYRQFLRRVDQASKNSLSPEEQADLELIRLASLAALLDLNDVQSYRHNPTMYVEMIGNGLYSPLVLEYAPFDKRMGQIISRMEQIPAVLETAKKNLVDAPAVWVNVAVEENEGNVGLIDQTIRAKVPESMRKRFDGAASSALKSLRAFNDYLKRDLSQHQSDWRLGENLYDRKFQLSLATGISPAEALKDAEEALTRIRDDMGRQAKAVYPKYFPGKRAPAEVNQLVSSVLDRIAADHVTPDKYFEQAKQDLQSATEFVKEHNLMPLPKVSELSVIPTPEFMRGIYGVGGFAPAPALAPQLGSFYWITPLTPDMGPDRIESKLREYNRYGLEILTIHEAMPGHYLQSQFASGVQPKWRGTLRNLYGNTPYVEGWAVYATEMMIANGYDKTPEMQLTFGKQMLRVVSNTILDIRLHTRGMTDEQAMRLMVDNTFQEGEEAEKKLQRAKLSSCQLPTYFVGWSGWDRLKKDYAAAKGGNFSLHDFHERALNEGAVSLPALHKLLIQ
jgi:uncharacterized protein (DUF885 family)